MRQPPPLQDWLKYPVTSAVATIALFVSVAKFAGADVSFLYDSSNSGNLQVWGLITSVFPHGNFIHLAFNLYWLWVFGTLVEAVYGPARTAAIFMLFAVGSSAAEFAFFEGGIGLSGVGYGLFALLWVLSKHDERFHNSIDTSTINLFVVWFFLCIYLTYADILRVGNVAHGMGAVLGAMLGFCIVSEGSVRQMAEVSLGLVLVASFLLATLGRAFVNLAPVTWEKSAYLGYQELVDHNYQEAVHHLQTAVRLNPHEAGNWCNLGIAYAQMGMEEKARDALRHACEERPSSRQFRERFASATALIAYRKQLEGKNEEAVRLYKESLEMDESSSVSWYNLALAYEQLRNLPLAKDAAKKAIELDPKNEKFQSFYKKLEE